MPEYNIDDYRGFLQDLDRLGYEEVKRISEDDDEIQRRGWYAVRGEILGRWLAEQERTRSSERREKWGFWITVGSLTVAVLSLLVAILALVG